MAVNFGYVARETGSNLTRNITLTLASILTVAVSLALVGASFLVRNGVENATLRWQGGIEFIIFMNADIEASQQQALKRDLDANPEIKQVKYVDKEASLNEAKRLLRDQPETLQALLENPDSITPSYRIVPRDPSLSSIRALQELYKGRPGVYQIMSADETIRSMQRITGVINVGLTVTAIALLIASALLIFNTIQTAMYARRREIEVMKLVGATNWFIRVPFMLEGLIQGLIGSALAIAAMFGLNQFFESRLQSQDGVPLLSDFVVTNSNVLVTCVTIGVAGALVGLISSAVAATWFLDV